MILSHNVFSLANQVNSWTKDVLSINWTTCWRLLIWSDIS